MSLTTTLIHVVYIDTMVNEKLICNQENSHTLRNALWKDLLKKSRLKL